MGLKQHLFVLIVCASPAAQAQVQLPSAPLPQAASISGTVTDINDDVIPQTTILLDGNISSDHRVIVANADGFFKLEALHPGTYRLTVRSKGFAEWVSPGLTLAPGQNLDMKDITLQLATAMTSVEAKSYTQQEIATQEVKIEETQRIVGVIPNFYVVYSHNYAPISAKQKFSLAWRSSIDPANLAIVGIFAGVQQGLDAVPEWGQDWPGYGQRYGALLAGGTTDLALTGFVFPTLLHQDPRYFYKGTGSIRSRIFYAMATTTVMCKGDNGRWQPNYSNFLGNLGSAGITNYYYPATDRGIGLTFENAIINTASGAISGLFEEFLLPHFTSHARAKKP